MYERLKSHRRRTLAALFLTLLGTGAPALAAPVRFWFVPEAAWNGVREQNPQALEERIENATVRLYRVGSYEAELEVPGGEIVDVPRGTWTWIAEAPGFVTAAAGFLSVGDERREPMELLWWMAPACTVSLADDRWQGVQRLDAVSLEYGAVYPLLPGTLETLQIPAGPYLAYSVSSRGIEAISPPTRCRRDEKVSLARPSPPEAADQDFVLHLEPPEEESRRLEPVAFLRSRQKGSLGRAILPTALVEVPGRTSLFFLGVPATDVELVAETERYQTVRSHFEDLGGGVRERAYSLHGRHELSFAVDYQPEQRHRDATIRVFHCGTERDRNVPPRSCRELETDLTLKPGVREYRLDDLDWGQYRLVAEIDDFLLASLGRPFPERVAPFLPYGEPSPTLESFTLEEYHLYGHVLLEGEPVEGYVELNSTGGGPTLRAPTDEELFYHLYYFAEAVGGFGRTRPEIRDAREPRDIAAGLPVSYGVCACSLEKLCRCFNGQSKFRGEGRLDFEIGANVIEVTAVAADTGEPVANALVWAQGRNDDPALVFEDGEVDWIEQGSADGLIAHTDAAGRARLAGIAPGPRRIDVNTSGFERAAQEVEIPETGRLEIRFDLEPKDDEKVGAVSLVTPRGYRLARAAVFPVGPDGRLELGCRHSADAEGRVDFKDGCLGRGLWVVLHPEAAITAVDDSAFTAGGQVTIDGAPRPLRLRVLDQQGTPAGGVPIALYFGSFSLWPDDLLAASPSGLGFPYRTDSSGEILLRGIESSGSNAPTVELLFGDDEAAFDLRGYAPGEVVTIYVDR